ncbi:MAG: multicopper oxidase [Methanomassiliicoccales archaeon PtaU1.Bin124]|nr:MAG: multicopper oxidase [Methanomassiliicoccales archaeon PtaU1.Bin124]
MLATGLIPPALAAPPGLKDLDPSSIPKFTNQLDGPPAVFTPTTMLDPTNGLMTDHYSIIASEFYQQILPTVDQQGRPTGLPATKVWGYGGLAHDAVTGKQLGFVRSSPSPTIEAVQGRPANVAWINSIYTPYLYAADSSIDINNQNNTGTAIYPVTTTVHVMGMESSSMYDGHPYSWVTWNGLHGPEYYTYKRTMPNAAVYHYDNVQSPATLYFHDRAIGLTRSNCYSGLSGFYILRDMDNATSLLLPSGKYDVPLSIQDRNFYADGTLKLPTQNLPGPNDTAAWVREFMGNVITVNGLAWPNMDVDRGIYLLRLLDGSGARWYDLALSNGMAFTVLAKDGYYLDAPLRTNRIILAPGERADILVDFSSFDSGTKIALRNSASAPYPFGKGADANTGVVMQFTVGPESGYQAISLPSGVDSMADYVASDEPVAERYFTLLDFIGEAGDSMATLDGQLFRSGISELPKVGTTELWHIVDSTRSSHLIEVGLAHLKVVSRQGFSDRYDYAWLAANGGKLPFKNPTVNIDMTGYLLGTAYAPSAIDTGWRDCVVVNPGEVVTVLVRFAPVDGRTAFAFDPTIGPTYIWYSHILDHEENEMMRQIEPGW